MTIELKKATQAYWTKRYPNLGDCLMFATQEILIRAEKLADELDCFMDELEDREDIDVEYDENGYISNIWRI